MSDMETAGKIIVLNGEYYAGRNNDENLMILEKRKSDAKILAKSEMCYVLQSILHGVMNGEIDLKRIEVLRA